MSQVSVEPDRKVLRLRGASAPMIPLATAAVIDSGGGTPPLAARLVRCDPDRMTEDTSAAELRALIGERVRAIASRDAQYLADAQDPEVLAFNVLPPLRLRGSDQVAEQTRAWFDGYADGPGYDVHDLRIDVDGSVGSTAFLYHVTGTLHSGDEVSMWVRATLVWKRIDGRWRIVHDHESIPWDPSTGQGLASLEP
ncbi:hypothetical protein ASF42_07810 [Rathayibacter sp. Leaf294]|nr:hypothetical protein ASF42_07810 [Rathayibacter sp. Leaf294]